MLHSIWRLLLTLAILPLGFLSTIAVAQDQPSVVGGGTIEAIRIEGTQRIENETVLSYFRAFAAFAALPETDQMQCRYLEREILDSLGIVGLVSELERAFDVQFSMDDFESEQFQTPAGLVAIVGRLTNGKS